jgi:pyruvate,water dikinase
MLVAHGFPVPRTVAVTVDAYWAYVDDAGLGPALTELGRRDIPPPDRLEEEHRETERLFTAAPLPSAVRDEIVAAAADLLENGPIAVRSSALAEDMTIASFAGQYLSVLNVMTPDEAVGAVRRCWASLWSPAVRAYRKREGLDELELGMGVLLQAMVPADYAGVVFTSDPVGDPECAHIEMVPGLGESLVSGAVTPDVFWVHRTDLTIAGHEGDIPAFLEDLARMGMRIERRLGGPQDIEFAYADGRLMILQSRPVTTPPAFEPDDDGFDTTPEPGAVYTSAGIQEMLPEVVSPLLWSINAPMLDDAFRRLLGDLGITVANPDGPFLVLGRFRGRAALNLSVLRRAAALVPGGDPDDVDRQYVQRVLAEAPELEPIPERTRGGRLRTGFDAVRIRGRLEQESALVTDATHLILALGVDPSSLPVDRLLAYWSRIRGIAWRAYAAEVAASAGAAAAYRAFESTLERWMDSAEAALWAQRATAGPVAARQPGCSCVAEFWDLYAGRMPGDALRKALESDGHESAVTHAMDRASRHFGSRALYGDVTWDEDRTVVVECFRALAEGIAPDPVVRLQTAREERKETLAQLKNVLKQGWRWRLTRVVTGQIVDMRARMLDRLAGDAAELLSIREESKAALLTLGGEERRLIRETARRLVGSGHLAIHDDIDLLTYHELEEALMGRELVAPSEMERRRTAHRLAVEGEPLPEHFRGRPGSETVPPPSDAEILEGWAASPGVVRGTARVISNISEGSSLDQGDILVARSTDPSWTPLFMVAGGIVLEEGGPLSHAAIVAREFGLPAVLKVRGATKVIADGEEISVDGTTGTVARMERETVG